MPIALWSIYTLFHLWFAFFFFPVLPLPPGFHFPREAKTRASYKSRDVLFIGSDFGPDSLTDSGYPRTIREWVRGTDIDLAPTVFEGEKADVSVSSWIDDQRHRGAGIYEIRSRSLTFYTSRYWVRKVSYEHLLALNDPKRLSCGEPPNFSEVNVPRDAEIDFFANLLLISLRSDWSIEGKNISFLKGSLICVDYDEFLSRGVEGSRFSMLFEPSKGTALDTYSATKNYIILSIMDNVQSQLVFLFYDPNIQNFVPAGGDSHSRIRAANVGAYDSYNSDKFWLTTSGFLQPSTLYMANAEKVRPFNDVKPDTNLAEVELEDVYIDQKLRALPPQFNAKDLEAVQRFAMSKDGTQIPYFLIYKRGTKMDGNTPTLLYGKEIFSTSLSFYTASHLPTLFPFLL
jgi:prolyl oligopeptidase